MRVLFLFVLIFFLSVSAYAEKRRPLIQIKKTPHFNLPLDCTLGENCWVMNYVDMGADDGKNIDPACQSRTYDAHKGTDIAILDENTMQNGVNVIAPLDGTVTKIRDGEEDLWATDDRLEEIKAKRKECGNAVMIDHGNNVETIYCHMKKNSIAVKPNQKIKAGDIIGQVGLSGLTQFPHLHFGIIKEGKIIDPFTGQNNTAPCGKKIESLWNEKLNASYQPFILHNAGFLNDIPNLSQIEKNGKSSSQIPQESNLLTFWSTLFGVREGDRITLEILDPNGKTFGRREITQDTTRARQFYYTGRKTDKNRLIEGVYTGSITIEREYKGQTLKDTKSSAVLIIK
jgi:hypothetical protein